jgi:UDP-glucuronate 4-epimerase
MLHVIVTGCAGFIGFHVSQQLLQDGCKVIGIDNLNPYYDVKLKEARLELLFNQSEKFTFIQHDISTPLRLDHFESTPKYTLIHLAAQAGVRYSRSNPDAYVDANIIGTYNILKVAKSLNVQRLLFSSTSSVYGNSVNTKNNENDDADHPVQFYATTKRINELMIQHFSFAERIPSLIFRLFTVYGPWGRPDMALFKFASNIIKNMPIELYNSGSHNRSFTYIDDVIHYLVTATLIAQDKFLPIDSVNNSSILNLGNPDSRNLIEYVGIIERTLNLKASILKLPLQVGDVLSTNADITKLNNHFGHHSFVPIELGVQKFIEWYVARETQ